MVFERTTSLQPEEVLDSAIKFFAQRVPLYAAFPERRGPEFLTLRGQGGEEIAIAASRTAETTRVRASTLLFDQQLDRFLGTLPPVRDVA
jgi:hypothetical protein